jgi:hypothetical protein
VEVLLPTRSVYQGTSLRAADEAPWDSFFRAKLVWGGRFVEGGRAVGGGRVEGAFERRALERGCVFVFLAGVGGLEFRTGVGGRGDDPTDVAIGSEEGQFLFGAGAGSKGVHGGAETGEGEVGGLLIESVAEERVAGGGHGGGGADRLELFVVGDEEIADGGVLRRLLGSLAGGGGVVDFQEDVRSGFFGRPELGITRALNLSDPEIAALGLLIDLVGHKPGFGTVGFDVVGEDEFGEGFVGLDVNVAVNIGADFGEAGHDTDCGLLDVGGDCVVGGRLDEVRAFDGAGAVVAKVGEFAGQVGDRGTGGGGEPVDGAEEDAHAFGGNGDDEGQLGGGFDLILDGADGDGVLEDGDENAAGGEIGDDFFGGVFLSAGTGCRVEG